MVEVANLLMDSIFGFKLDANFVLMNGRWRFLNLMRHG